MPIYSRLQESALNPEEIKIIAGAFEAVCKKLGLVHREDPVCDMVARLMMDCVYTGNAI